MAIIDRHAQGPIVQRMHISVVSEQQIYRLRASPLSRPAQSLVVDRMYIGSSRKKNLYRLRMASIGRSAQRMIVSCVHIGAVSEQRLYCRRIAVAGRSDWTVIQVLLLIWGKVLRFCVRCHRLSLSLRFALFVLSALATARATGHASQRPRLRRERADLDFWWCWPDLFPAGEGAVGEDSTRLMQTFGRGIVAFNLVIESIGLDRKST